MLKNIYEACLTHDKDKEMELFLKALKKNVKSHDQKKTTTVTQVLIKD